MILSSKSLMFYKKLFYSPIQSTNNDHMCPATADCCLVTCHLVGAALFTVHGVWLSSTDIIWHTSRYAIVKKRSTQRIVFPPLVALLVIEMSIVLLLVAVVFGIDMMKYFACLHYVRLLSYELFTLCKTVAIWIIVFVVCVSWTKLLLISLTLGLFFAF